MGAAEQRAKSAKMAADMKAKGVFHGKRQSVTHAPPVPAMNDVGSAAYRRMQQSKRKGVQ